MPLSTILELSTPSWLSGRPVEPAFGLDQLRLNHRRDDELRDAFHRLHRVGGWAAVPAAHHQRALVVAVDQADEVAQHDAVLVAQPRARQDHGGQTRVADVDGDARGDELGLPGCVRDVAQRRLQRATPGHDRGEGVRPAFEAAVGLPEGADEVVGCVGQVASHAALDHVCFRRSHPQRDLPL